MAMEMSNPLVEGEYAARSSVEGVQNFTPLQTTQKGFNNPQITTFKSFDMFIAHGIEFNQKIGFGQEVDNFIL